MKLYLKSPNEAVFECDYAPTLMVAQAMCDGSKIRNEPRIIFPVRSLPKMAKILKDWYKIASPEALKKTMEVSASIKYRKERIKAIRDEYVNQTEKISYYTFTGRFIPLKHQLTMFKAMVELNCAAILADPGTCKTGAYLWAIECRKQRGDISKTLIITLSHLKENVQEEMKAQTPGLTSIILSNKVQANAILNKGYKSIKKNKDYDVYIANYESMFTLVDLIPEGYFQMVILDEAHRIGSPRIRQTKVIVDKFEYVPYKYIVTGTLNANNCTSFYMPFRFLGPDTVPEANFYEFRARHFFTVDPEKHIWVASPGTHGIVKDLIGKVSICFKKEECIDLPPKIYQVYKCEMSKAQQEQYDNVKKELIFIIKDNCKNCAKMLACDMSCNNTIMIKNILVQITKLSQITCGFFINTKKKIDDSGREVDASEVIWFEENPKLNLLISIIQNIPEDKKVIIWSNYVAGVKIIEARLKKVFGEESCISIYGSDDAFDKINQFETDPKKRFLSANQKKAGTGFNIQFSSYQVFFSNDYSYICRDQAEARQHRQGQKDSVTIADVVCRDTIDETKLEILKSKKDLAMDLSSLARVAGVINGGREKATDKDTK